MFDKFLIAQDIQTPETKLLKDIREFVLPKISDEQIDLMRKNPESWGKIVRLTERLEFVDRLDRIRHEIISQMKPDKKSNKGGKEIKEFVCTWLGCDFAGCHKDIEAMEIALLVAAIDAIVEDHDYKKLDEWLQERWDEKEIDSKAHLAKLLQEHSNRYGMMKGMRRAFRELVDADVKQEWLKSYCVIKVMEGVNGDDQLKKGMEDWNMNGDDKKLKLLMDALAECRKPRCSFGVSSI